MKTIENKITNIGSKIKYHRLLNKISLSKLANDANISKSTLFGLEEGRSNPTISTLINIASTLGITLNELIQSNQDSSGNSNLTLISAPDNKKYKIYKLSLLPNELFKLKNYKNTTFKIEVTDGSLALVDNSLTLSSSEVTRVKFNTKFKACNSGATAIIKIYTPTNSINYLKEDTFYKFGTKEILQDSIKNAQNRLISRVIFTSITPIESIKPNKYMNYLEVLSNKESNYYIFKRYQGLQGGINCYLKSIGYNKKSIKYKNIKEFLTQTNIKQHLEKDNFKLLNTHILNDTKNLLIDATKECKKDTKVVESIYDIDSQTLKEGSYILLLENLSSTTNTSALTIWLYRALESLYITQESALNNDELKLYNTIIQKLLESLYLSYNGYTNGAIATVESLLLDFDKLKIINIESKFIKNYLNIWQQLKDIVKKYEHNITINSTSATEAVAKDLNLTIESKELISNVENGNGLYAYLFRVN